jgi:uncharacterized protein YndB with AHSA1/START domain
MKTITAEYDLPRPPEKVWRALTEPKLLAAWLMDNDIAPVVGHKFTFKATPMPGWDGIVHCEILAVEAPRLLRYSWRGGRLDTTVTWTLSATDGGTRVRMEHAGFTDADQMAYDGMSKGWHGKVAERLQSLLAEI